MIVMKNNPTKTYSSSLLFEFEKTYSRNLDIEIINSDFHDVKDNYGPLIKMKVLAHAYVHLKNVTIDHCSG
jgi:hypothetical protein